MQDVFGIVPGDTDYRIFANDHGNIPGLDIIFLIGGYYYHTSGDTVERLLYAYCYFGTVHYIKLFRTIGLSQYLKSLICGIHMNRPGSIQARGENVIRIVKAFTLSTKMQNAYVRESLIVNDGLEHERPIFFDYMSWFLVKYEMQAFVSFKFIQNIFLW